MNRDKIGPGDVCVILGPMDLKRCHPETLAAYVGTECTVTKGPFLDWFFESSAAYEIRTYDGKSLDIDSRLLRKKRPPESKSSWDLIEKDTGWNPKHAADRPVCPLPDYAEQRRRVLERAIQTSERRFVEILRDHFSRGRV